MKLLKTNFYDIIRLYIFQIGITIFSLFLYTAVGFVEDAVFFNRLRIAVSVFSMVFYFVLIYYMLWEMGAKDKIRIDGGRMEPMKGKGMLLCLFANIPNFIISFVSLLLIVVFLIGGSQGVWSGYVATYTINLFHESIYMGFIQGVVPEVVSSDPQFVDYTYYLVQSILFVVFPTLSILVGHFSYYLGSKEKKFLTLFSSKKSN